jgi:hypothetical protein
MKATLADMKIVEVPITLHKDGRSRPPHLKPWRDGWRHLRFMLIYSPRWLFLVPGLVLAGLGAIAALLIYFRALPVGTVNFDTGAFAVVCGAIIAGVQLVGFACLTKVFAIGEGLLPPDPKFARVFRLFTLERGLVVGLVALLAGAAMLLWAVWVWRQAHFGNLPYADNMRRVIAATTFLLFGVQVMAVSLFMSVLGLRTTTRRPPTPAG